MVWQIKHNRALHERLFVLTVTGESVPRVRDTERLSLEEIAPRFWRAAAHYGFMERPDIPALLHAAHGRGCGIDLSDVTYYVGHETVVHADDERALPRWVEAVFAVMQRNSAHLTDYFRLPVEAVVEIGRGRAGIPRRRQTVNGQDFVVAPYKVRRVRAVCLPASEGVGPRDAMGQAARLPTRESRGKVAGR